MSWIFIIVAVVGVVIAIANMAAKKKAAAERERRQREAGGAAPPPRPSTMSDIQKAFMMMTGEETPPEQPSAPVYSPEGRSGGVEGASSYEGSAGKTEGFSSYEGTSGKTEGFASYEGSLGKTEGMATEGFEFHGAGAHSIGNMYANVDLDKLSSRLNDSDETEIVFQSTEPKKGTIRLFESKNDFRKAVIYSEILKRKAR